MARKWREQNQKGPAVVNSRELSLLPREEVKSFLVNEDQKSYVISVGESTHRTELLVKMITSGYGKKDDWLVKGKMNRHF